MHFKLCTSGLPHRSRRVRRGPSPSSAVCTGFSMKNRWELSSHLYWWSLLLSPGSSLAVQYLSLRDNTILQRRSTAFCEFVCKRHVCMELQRNRQVSKQPPEFPGTKCMKNVFLMWKHQKTLASSCGHVYIINAHICRCGHTGTRDRVQPHYKQSRAKSASRIIWDLSSSLQTREHPLFPRQRSVIPEPKSHAALILRLVQSLVLYSLCVFLYICLLWNAPASYLLH